jgi:hypothetical protein
MHMIRKLSVKFPFLFLLLPLTIAVAAPLTQNNICPAIVQQALAELAENCNLLDRNSVCYGYNQVGATFNEPQPDDFFSKASDTSSLTIVDTLETAPLDEQSNTWGVALMKVQANVPNSLPGQAVTFILLGDTEIRNEVSPEDAFVPADPVDVTVIGSVNIRSGPNTRSNVLGSATDGTVLSADGRSEDGGWLRVLFQDRLGWISAELVSAPESVGELPVLTGQQRTPMQSFYLRTGVGTTSCDEAPDLLVVQGPENLKVDLTVNGADIQIGSTIVLFSVESPFGDLLNDPELIQQFGSALTNQDIPADLVCSVMQIVVIDGGAEINNGILDLPTGFTARSINCGAADRTSGFSTPWGGTRPLTADELRMLQTLNDLPPEVLNYPIRVPTLGDIQTFLQSLNAGASGNTVTNGPAAGGVECSTLRPTSPLGTMPGKDTPFYWDAAAGATSYTVRVYDSGGALVAEYSVAAPQTNLVGNPDAKDSLSWEVSAYVNGQLACTSSRVTVVRDVVYESAPPPPENTVICHAAYMMCPPTCSIIGNCGYMGKDTLCSCPP